MTLTLSKGFWAGTSGGGATYGYNAGGYAYSLSAPISTIQKFSFAGGGTASAVGNLSSTRSDNSGANSDTHGYSAGGDSSDTIDKYSFASAGTASDIGNLTASVAQSCGQSSSTDGYASGGLGPTGTTNKYSFATDSQAPAGFQGS